MRSTWRYWTLLSWRHISNTGKQ